MLLVATALSGCDSLQQFGFGKERQKQISQERRTPSMNPGGGSTSSYAPHGQQPRQQLAQANFSNGFGNAETPKSAPPITVAKNDFPSMPPRQPQQYAMAAPAPSQAAQYAEIAPAAGNGYVPQPAYPMQNAQVIAEPLAPPPQQQQYAINAPQAPAYAPPIYAPKQVAPQMPQYAPQPPTQQMQQQAYQQNNAQQFAAIAPAAGYAPQAPLAPSQPQQQYAGLTAQPQIQAAPVSVQQQQPQAYAQAQQAPAQPNNDASFWRDFYAYSQPQSSQNQGYPELAAVPQAPQHRGIDQYKQDMKALEEQARAPYQPTSAQPQYAAPTQQMPQYAIQQPQMQQQYAPPMPQIQQQAVAMPPTLDVPASVPAPRQMLAQPSAPSYGNYGYAAQDPTLRAPEQLQQYPSAIPLPPGSYVFSTSDGRKITLTPPPRSSNETL